MSDFQRIAQEINTRRITRLCHFTRISKLLHILSTEEGIMATADLNEECSDLLTQNDKMRLDGYSDHVNCSIQYPNTYYLDSVRNSDPIFKNWVIIFIDPRIMCNSSTKFCYRNAAANCGEYVESGFKGLESMFQNTVYSKYSFTRTPQMLPCCPTDVQAEVLIYKNIPRTAILSIAAPTEEEAMNGAAMLKHIAEAPTVEWIVAPDLFNNNWIRLVKRGYSPDETSLSTGGGAMN